MLDALTLTGRIVLGVLLLGLSLGGVLLSGLSLSGTWLVVIAAALAALFWPGPLPGWGTVAGFALIAAGVEVIEFLAGAWGVTRRGGSAWAGLAAIVGGALGLLLGTLIPIPAVGSLLGMLLGGFALVFAVEYRRLRSHARAAHIAWGSVSARLLMVLLKVGVSLLLSGWLFVELLLR